MRTRLIVGTAVQSWGSISYYFQHALLDDSIDMCGDWRKSERR